MLPRWSHYAVWVSSKKRSSVSLCLMRCLMNMLYSPTPMFHFPYVFALIYVCLCISCHVHVDKLCKDRRAALAKAEAASGFALSPDQCEAAGWASYLSLWSLCF